MAEEKTKKKWMKSGMHKISSLEDQEKEKHQMIANENMNKAAQHNAHMVYKASASHKTIMGSFYGHKE